MFSGKILLFETVRIVSSGFRTVQGLEFEILGLGERLLLEVAWKVLILH